MFREMRRPEQALTKEQMIELIQKETRGVLSVIGDDGYPYGFPINHYYDEEENKFYFHGAQFGHHIDAIKAEPKVSYCVYGDDEQREDDWAYYVKSVISFGKAEIIEDYSTAMKFCYELCKRFPCDEEYIKKEFEADAHRTLVFAINVEYMTGKLVHEA
ncbi:MAG: pyridoxamine 5'-phosphate oxidase family protein [Firmicutes bacterium]|nr:pyridoxamine 5'-phosphate oxidase family protein [Bacillota bacterium]